MVLQHARAVVQVWACPSARTLSNCMVDASAFTAKSVKDPHSGSHFRFITNLNRQSLQVKRSSSPSMMILKSSDYTNVISARRDITWCHLPIRRKQSSEFWKSSHLQ